MIRKYELNRRAERQAETRNRIVQATVGLHTSVGPAQTTISAIAERAGVQRHTVYAHFRDERTLFDACSAHWAALHPFPDASLWTDADDPQSRLRAALDAVYEWYERVGYDLEIFKRDSGVHATTAALVARREQGLLSLRDGLAAGWSRRKAVRAAIGHALELETWHSLVQRHGLTRTQAVDAMLRFVASV
ncbi:MAG: TetR/AcrR family transcriptional regulator [Actinomycetota bacterium]|nr:TetR/AcrR family transcriptional regulator [Actinomycetota bacterium]